MTIVRNRYVTLAISFLWPSNDIEYWKSLWKQTCYIKIQDFLIEIFDTFIILSSQKRIELGPDKKERRREDKKNLLYLVFISKARIFPPYLKPFSWQIAV